MTAQWHRAPKSSKYAGLSQLPNDKVFSSTEVTRNLLIKMRRGGIKILWSGKPCSWYAGERVIRYQILHPPMSYGVQNQIRWFGDPRHHTTSYSLWKRPIGTECILTPIQNGQTLHCTTCYHDFFYWCCLYRRILKTHQPFKTKVLQFLSTLILEFPHRRTEMVVHLPQSSEACPLYQNIVSPSSNLAIGSPSWQCCHPLQCTMYGLVPCCTVCTGESSGRDPSATGRQVSYPLVTGHFPEQALTLSIYLPGGKWPEIVTLWGFLKGTGSFRSSEKEGQEGKN